MGANPGRRAMQDPELGEGWDYRKIEPRPVYVKIGGTWRDGWLTEVITDPYGEQWGWGYGESVPWNGWKLRRSIKPRRVKPKHPTALS